MGFKDNRTLIFRLKMNFCTLLRACAMHRDYHLAKEIIIFFAVQTSAICWTVISIKSIPE
jgi:hypothetical protein